MSAMRIKCSLCNGEVDLELMADHDCSTTKREETTSNAFPLQKAAPTKTSSQLQKTPTLPPIDSLAANRPFIGRDQPTPSSSTSGSQTHSPATPRDGQPIRTPAHVHGGSLSPNHHARNSENSLKSPGLSPASLHSSRGSNGQNQYYAPVSPTVNSGKNVAVRMNNIAPGPFGVNPGNSKDRQQEILPGIAASFPERNQPRGMEEVRDPLYAILPGREEEKPGHRRELTDGSIIFGFEETKRQDIRGNSGARRGSDRDRVDDKENHRERDHRERDPRESERKMGMKEIDMRSRERDRRTDRNEHRRPPATGSDHSPQTENSQLPGPEPSPSFRKEQDAPAVKYVAYKPPVAPSKSASSHGRRPKYSDTGPARSRIEAMRPENRAQTFPERNERKASTGRLPPHPGLGLPESPSQTVHIRNKSSIKAMMNLPLPPIPNSPGQKPPVERRQLSQSLTNSNKLEDAARGASQQPRGESPTRPRSPPTRPRSPPAEQRPPVHTQAPPKQNEYLDHPAANPYVLSSSQPVHNNTSSVSSQASSVFSHRSMRSESSMGSPPASETSSTPKINDSASGKPKRCFSEDSIGMEDIDGLMQELQCSMHELNPTPLKENFDGLAHNEQEFQNDDRPGSELQPQSLQISHPPQYEAYVPNNPEICKLRAIEPPAPPPSLPLPPTPQQQQHQREPTQESAPRKKSLTKVPKSKGNCRGCGEAIVGKSISSADGRLTGRYHKACFSCQACQSPFTSAEFYVLDNLPYCERHYHKLNRSLCPTCDRGIEGPCLETERRERFHPTCFTCTECRVVLGDDYFDLNGRPYCERHAHRVLTQQGSRLGPNQKMANMERRKTRMMMMM